MRERRSNAGVPSRRGARLAVAGVTLLVLILLVAVVVPGAAIVMVVIAALVLCLAVPVGLIVAARQQPKPGRKDFGGRYTYFGPVLAWLNRAPERSRVDPGVARPRGSDDETTKPPTGAWRAAGATPAPIAVRRTLATRPGRSR